MENILKFKLIGSWDLLSFSSISAAGSISYPLGQDARGALIYSVDGYVAVNIMMSNRPSFIQPSSFAKEELRYLDLPYLSYTGTYMIDEKRPSVTHLVEICIYPEWIGQRQFRLIKWNAEELELSSDGIVGSDQTQFKLLWRKKI
jgi:Lipocalin-like domain